MITSRQAIAVGSPVVSPGLPRCSGGRIAGDLGSVQMDLASYQPCRPVGFRVNGRLVRGIDFGGKQSKAGLAVKRARPVLVNRVGPEPVGEFGETGALGDDEPTQGREILVSGKLDMAKSFAASHMAFGQADLVAKLVAEGTDDLPDPIAIALHRHRLRQFGPGIGRRLLDWLRGHEEFGVKG